MNYNLYYYDDKKNKIYKYWCTGTERNPITYLNILLKYGFIAWIGRHNTKIKITTRIGDCAYDLLTDPKNYGLVCCGCPATP